VDQPAGDAAATPSNDGRGPALSQEFFLRVNDFIQMANRIERRYDTHHAQLAFLHAFARYSGHHFRTTTTVDDEENREAFADYIGGGVKQLILGHLADMAGGPQAGAPAAADSTDATSEASAPREADGGGAAGAANDAG
jgi:hypothetical protein